MTNILILSCGTRNKIVHYFRQALSLTGNVIATDCSALAPALYEANVHYIVPKMTENGYLDALFNICEKEEITGVFSLIDPELSLLAKNADRFAKIGTTVIGSSYEVAELSLDKWEMYNWLTTHHYACARSFISVQSFVTALDRGEIHFPVFIKPIKGSASIAVTKAWNTETVELLFRNEEGLMIQENLQGQEIGADCYIDMVSGEVAALFTKKKLLMRAGETDKSVSFKDPVLFDFLTAFVQEMGYRGAIDVDIFQIEDKYYISEVNPRFGGGYPHAYECGIKFPQMIIRNLQGLPNEVKIGAYMEDIYMMKYNEVYIK